MRGDSGATSGYKGVYARGDNWQAKPWKDGELHYLGTFDSKDDATAAVQRFMVTWQLVTYGQIIINFIQPTGVAFKEKDGI